MAAEPAAEDLASLLCSSMAERAAEVDAEGEMQATKGEGIRQC